MRDGRLQISPVKAGFASAFTNLRTDERCDDDNALLAAVLANATNLGLGRMAAASSAAVLSLPPSAATL